MIESLNLADLREPFVRALALQDVRCFHSGPSEMLDIFAVRAERRPMVTGILRRPNRPTGFEERLCWLLQFSPCESLSRHSRAATEQSPIGWRCFCATGPVFPKE